MQTEPPRSVGGPSLARLAPLLAGLLAAGLALLISTHLHTLADTDPYRHLVYARQLWLSGFALRGHPFLPFTLLGNSDADLWWGFHLLLIPFSGLGLVWGARLAGAAIAATQAGSAAWLYGRLGQRHGWLFALAPALLSTSFLNRDHVARPAHLTVPLVMLSLVCGAGEFAPWVAGLVAFAYGLLHLSAPVACAFCALGLLGARLAKAPGSPRALLYSVGGLGLALLVRPDREAYAALALIHNLGALGLGGEGPLAVRGGELAPIRMAHLASQAGPAAVLLLASVALGRGRERAGSPAVRAAALLGASAALLMTLSAQRFLDYLVPLLCLSAATWWPRELPSARWLRPTLAVGLTLALGNLAQGVKRAWVLGDATLAPFTSFEQMAALVRQRVPPGSVIVTDDLIEPSILWAYLPEYQFICAYEPALLSMRYPALYWRWLHATTEGTICEEETCPPAPPSADSVVELTRAFGSEWFFSFYTRPGFSVLPLIGHDRRFALQGTAPAPVGRLSLWHVATGGLE